MGASEERVVRSECSVAARKERVPFSPRARDGSRARGRRVATAGVAPPRSPRCAPSSSSSRAPAAGSSTAPCGRGVGTERGRVRAARASLATNAFGRGARRERTSIFPSCRRAARGARRVKRRLLSWVHSVSADASGVSAPRLAEMGGDHRGGKRHRHGVRGPRRLECSARRAAPRRSRDPAFSTCPPIQPGDEKATRARSTPSASPVRAAHRRTSSPF